MAVSQSSKVNPRRNLLKAALAYAKQGFFVIKLHGNAGKGRCTCGVIQCRYAAKHPTTPHGIKDATQDPAQIKAWFGNDPLCNIGIVFGSRCGVIDIETDTKHDGDTHIKALESTYGALPETFSFLSGTGGTHRLYRTSETIKRQIHFGASFLKADKTGIDVLAENSYAVAPPSIHANGKTYKRSNEHGPIPLPPRWLGPLKRGIIAPASDSAKALSQATAVLDDITAEQAQAMLATLDPDMDRGQWIIVGQALTASPSLMTGLPKAPSTPARKI